MTDQFTCGAARERITPEADLLPRLYGLMGRRLAGVHDDLYLRVIALGNGASRALIVSFDLDKAPRPREFVTALREATGIPEENILYFGIHTHTAPITGPRPPREQPPDQDAAQATAAYEAFLSEALLRAAQRALGTMVPVRLGVAEGESFINVNRNQLFHVTDGAGRVYRTLGLGADPTGPADKRVLILRAEDLEGRPVATLVNYAVHNVAMILNNGDGKGRVAVSADIGGNVSRTLEEQFGGVAVWSSGAAGDVNPVMMNQYYYPDPATGQSREFIPETDEAARAALLMMTTRHFDDIRNTLRTLRCQETSGPIAGAVRVCRTPGADGAGEYAIRLQGLRIGSTVLVGAAGELYTRLGRAVMEPSPFPHTAVINHNLSLLEDAGYIMDDETLARADPDCPVPGFIPGRAPRSAPGTIRPALTACAREIYQALEGPASPMSSNSPEGKETIKI